jgi:hypothetical protein
MTHGCVSGSAGWLAVVGLIALSSCAASAQIAGQLSACEGNPAKCEADCLGPYAQSRQQPRPGTNTYCDAFAVYRGERVVRGEGEQPPNPLYIRGQVTPWVAYVCEAEGVARACAVRDELRALETKLVAEAADQAAKAAARRAAFGAKIAEGDAIARDASRFPEYALSRASRIQLDQSLDFAKKAMLIGDLDAAGKAVDEMLTLAHQTQASAAEKVAALADSQAKGQAQARVVQAAVSACDANPGSCKTKCDSGDGPSCFAWATRLRKSPPTLAEAKVPLQKACDAGIVIACSSMPRLDADIQAGGREADDLWETVQQAADKITETRSQAAGIRALQPQMAPASQRQNERALQRMSVFVAASTQEKLCPAKRAFVAHSGVAEFSRRVADHCRAPAGQGYLDSAKCQATFATSCP